jgi:Cu/Ag efflux protein CusF
VRGNFIIVLSITAALAAGCSKEKPHTLVGQIVAIDTARQEITVKHQDIPGFMPGMTMPFRVREAEEMASR